MDERTELGKLDNPLVIRLSHLGNILLPLNGIEKEYDLNPGLLLSPDILHFGFVIIVDHNNKQNECYYRTDKRIVGLNFLNGRLLLFEEDKRNPWIFDKKGYPISINEATIDYSHKKCSIEMDEKGNLKQNDGLIKIVIDLDNEKEPITIDGDGKIYPIYPGLVLGNEYYGINIEIRKFNSETNEVEVTRKSYLTSDSLYGICIDEKYYSDSDVIKVYERDKYHPWEFSITGELVKEASYNKFSRKDKLAYEEKYGLKLR